MSDADVGLGTTIERGDGASPEVFTAVAEVVSISGPAFSREAVDFTHLKSANDYREFKAGVKDGGEVTFEGRWIPTNVTHNDTAGGVLADFEAGTPNNYRVVFPDTSFFEFSAFVTGLNPSVGGVNDPVNMSVTLKVSGKPTLTPSA